jgi:hypothetical protein
MFERRFNWQTAAWLLWRLERHGQNIQCIIGLQPHGFQGRYVCNGRLLYEYMFETWAEAASWARQRRLDLEAKGWIDATSLQRPGVALGSTGPTTETPPMQSAGGFGQ